MHHIHRERSVSVSVLQLDVGCASIVYGRTGTCYTISAKGGLANQQRTPRFDKLEEIEINTSPAWSPQDVEKNDTDPRVFLCRWMCEIFHGEEHEQVLRLLRKQAGDGARSATDAQ